MRLAINKSISESYKNSIIFYDAYLRIIFCNEIYSSKYAILSQVLFSSTSYTILSISQIFKLMK